MPTRREVLRTGAVLGAAGTGGCTSVADRRGTLVVRVRTTPRAFVGFSTCEFAVAGVDLDPERHDWTSHDAAATVDLSSVESGTRVCTVEPLAGSYERLRFVVADVEATRPDGTTVPITPPGRRSLVVPEPFEVRADARTVYTPTLTVIRAERTGRYGLRVQRDGTWVSFRGRTRADDWTEPGTG